MPDTDKIALIIGVDAYYHLGIDGKPSLPALRCCKKDAKDVADLLSSDRYSYTLYGNAPIIGSNLNNESGFVEIHKSIIKFFNDAQVNHILLFYFSGHGIQREEEIYLATPQVNPEEPMSIGFPLSNLTKLVNSTKAMRIICIVDACYSGAIKLSDPGMKPKGANKNAKQALAKYDRLVGDIPQTKTIWYFLSSQAYQKSIALKNNSIYTRYLLRGLRGVKPKQDKNGAVIYASGSVNDSGDLTPVILNQYVYAKVASKAPQIPGIKFEGSYSSDLILARFPKLAITRGVQSLTKTYQDSIRSLASNALEYYNNRDYSNALTCYQKILAIDSNNSDAYNGRGDVFYKLKKYFEAFTDYSKAIEIDPKNPKFWYSKFFPLFQLRRFQEAKESYDKAISLGSTLKQQIGKRQKFQPLPPPTGDHPYHLSLKDILSTEEVESILDSGGISFHTVGSTGGMKKNTKWFGEIVANHMIADFKYKKDNTNPAFLYLLGKIVYYWGEASQYYPQFYEPYKKYPAPIFAIPGSYDGNIRPDGTVFSLSAFVNNFCAPGRMITSDALDVMRHGVTQDNVRYAMTQPNVYWTLEALFVTIIGLYSNVPAEGEFDDDQVSWLIDEMRTAPKDKAVIVCVYHPQYSLDTYRGGRTVIGNVLDKAFNESGRIADLGT